MKPILYINFLVILIALYIFSPTIRNSINAIPKDLYNKITRDYRQKNIFYQIEEISNVISAKWINENEIVVITPSKGYLYNVSERKITKSYKIRIPTLNSTIGVDGNKVFICTWLNKTKDQPSDMGTNVRIINLDEDDKETNIDLNETLKVDSCSSKHLILSSAYDFMEYKTYEYDLQNNNLKVLVAKPYEPIYTLSGIDTIKIAKDGEKVLEIPYVNTYSEAIVRDKKSIVLIDTNKNIWVYLLRP